MITFDNVSKKFPDGTYGIINTSLEIKDGEFVFIIGQSGAGKTTLLKLLTCQIKPTEGTVTIDNKSVSKLKEKDLPKIRRQIGIVFQDFKLLKDQTVYENVALALEVMGQKEKKYKQKVLSTIEKVGLSGKEKYFPVQLSGGELQRVAIARALVTDTKILVADEPTGDLDPKTAWGVLNLLDEINKTGTTIIMATHNHAIVDAMQKRVLVVENGRIVNDTQNGKYTENSSTEKSDAQPIVLEDALPLDTGVKK